VIITFFAPSTPKPHGGVITIYEFANALVRRGHEVNLLHMTFTDDLILSTTELSWFEFEHGVRHYWPPYVWDPNVGAYRFGGSIISRFDVDPELVVREPLPSDIVFAYDESFPAECGLPVVLVQGIEIFPSDLDAMTFSQPCPQICVAGWLIEIGRRAGVPEEQLVHVPLGINHDKYRLLRPVERRKPQVAVRYTDHVTKGAEYAIEALERAKTQVPELSAVLFGISDPTHRIPDWVTYLRNPPQDVIVNDVYNASQIFVNASVVEGFGMPAVEAMACGCALVITDNGGATDYAIDGRTALVSPPRDADAMARNIVTLLRNDARRVDLATRGSSYVKRFNWDASAQTLENFLGRYLEEPARFQQRVRRSA
jgi:L-malate glycosyltransferase